MITTTDLDRIDTSYFQIIEVKEYTLVLRSRNTGHYWSLLERIANGCRTFVISHKHHVGIRTTSRLSGDPLTAGSVRLWSTSCTMTKNIYADSERRR